MINPRSLQCDRLEDRLTLSAASFASQEIGTLERGNRSVFLADLDSDGDLDALSASSQFDWQAVSWYANADGLGSFELVDEIDFSGTTVQVAQPADMDGDGDLDVVISTGQEVEWYRIDDGEFRFAGRVAGRQLVSSQKIGTADLDGDGDLDVVAASQSQLGTAWYENMDGQGSFDVRDARTIASPDILESLAVGDIDGDGRVDVLGATWRSNLLVWYENRVPGDANDDGIFNTSDLVQVFQAGKYAAADNATYDEGDWNGDGQFDSSDLVLAFKAGTYTAETEPAERDTAAAVAWLFAQEEGSRKARRGFVA